MFKRMASISPPPPEGFQSPLLWGTEEHVRELLGDGVEFERNHVEWTDPSPEGYAEFMENSFGPMIAARAQLGDDIVHETVLGWINAVNEADDGTVRFSGEYLVSVAPPS
jgi:hypothetical protein